MKKKILLLTALLFICLIIFLVIKNNETNKHDDKDDESSYVVKDFNNVNEIDKKIGDDIKITQSYLLNYLNYKSSIWYSSSGKITNVKKDNNNNIVYTINNVLKCYKSGDETFEVGTLVYFIGTYDFKTSGFNLAHIGTENVEWKDNVPIEFETIKDYINKFEKTYFVINGYLVLENNIYKLFNSSYSYQKENRYGKYLTVNFLNDENIEVNKTVNIRCKVSDTYELSECQIK